MLVRLFGALACLALVANAASSPLVRSRRVQLESGTMYSQFTCEKRELMIPTALPRMLHTFISFPGDLRYGKFHVELLDREGKPVPGKAYKGTILGEKQPFTFAYAGEAAVRVSGIPAAGADKGVGKVGVIPIYFDPADKRGVPREAQSDEFELEGHKRRFFVEARIFTSRMPLFFYLSKPTFRFEIKFENKEDHTIAVKHETCGSDDGDDEEEVAMDLLVDTDALDAELARDAAQWGFIKKAWEGTKKAVKKGADHVVKAANKVAEVATKTFKRCKELDEILIPAHGEMGIELTDKHLGVDFAHGVGIHTKIFGVGLNAHLRYIRWSFAEGKLQAKIDGAVKNTLLKGVLGIFNKFMAKRFVPDAFRREGYSPSDDPEFVNNLNEMLAKLGGGKGKEAKEKKDAKVFDLFGRSDISLVDARGHEGVPPKKGSIGERLGAGITALAAKSRTFIDLSGRAVPSSDHDTCFSVGKDQTVRLGKGTGAKGTIHFVIPTLGDQFGFGPLAVLNSLKVRFFSLVFDSPGIAISEKLVRHRKLTAEDKGTSNIAEIKVVPVDGGSSVVEKGRALVREFNKDGEFHPAGTQEVPFNLEEMWNVVARLKDPRLVNSIGEATADLGDDAATDGAECRGFLGQLVEVVQNGLGNNMNRAQYLVEDGGDPKEAKEEKELEAVEKKQVRKDIGGAIAGKAVVTSSEGDASVEEEEAEEAGESETETETEAKAKAARAAFEGAGEAKAAANDLLVSVLSAKTQAERMKMAIAAASRVNYDDQGACISTLGHVFAKAASFVYQNPRKAWLGYAGCQPELTPFDKARRLEISQLRKGEFPGATSSRCPPREYLVEDYEHKVHRFIPVEVIEYTRDNLDVQSFVFEVISPDEPRPIIALVIRGSDSSRDWCVNLNVYKKLAKDINGDVLPGPVHAGIHKHWATIRRRAIGVLRRYSATHKVVIAGHSLGAGASSLGAYDIAAALFDRKAGSGAPLTTADMGVFLYGTPRVGSKEYATAYDRVLGPVTFNYAAHFTSCLAGMPLGGQDLVSAIPPTSFGYVSLGEKGSYPGATSHLCRVRCSLSCPEDTDCGKSTPGACHYLTSVAWCHGPREYADAFILGVTQRIKSASAMVAARREWATEGSKGTCRASVPEPRDDEANGEDSEEEGSGKVVVDTTTTTTTTTGDEDQAVEKAREPEKLQAEEGGEEQVAPDAVVAEANDNKRKAVAEVVVADQEEEGKEKVAAATDLMISALARDSAGAAAALGADWRLGCTRGAKLTESEVAGHAEELEDAREADQGDEVAENANAPKTAEEAQVEDQVEADVEKEKEAPEEPALSTDAEEEDDVGAEADQDEVPAQRVRDRENPTTREAEAVAGAELKATAGRDTKRAAESESNDDNTAAERKKAADKRRRTLLLRRKINALRARHARRRHQRKLRAIRLRTHYAKLRAARHRRKIARMRRMQYLRDRIRDQRLRRLQQ